MDITTYNFTVEVTGGFSTYRISGDHAFYITQADYGAPTERPKITTCIEVAFDPQSEVSTTPQVFHSPDQVQTQTPALLQQPKIRTLNLIVMEGYVYSLRQGENMYLYR